MHVWWSVFMYTYEQLTIAAFIFGAVRAPSVTGLSHRSIQDLILGASTCGGKPILKTLRSSSLVSYDAYSVRYCTSFDLLTLPRDIPSAAFSGLMVLLKLFEIHDTYIYVAISCTLFLWSSRPVRWPVSATSFRRLLSAVRSFSCLLFCSDESGETGGVTRVFESRTRQRCAWTLRNCCAKSDCTSSVNGN